MITFKSGNEKILQVDKEESQESGEKNLLKFQQLSLMEVRKNILTL